MIPLDSALTHPASVFEPDGEIVQCVECDADVDSSAEVCEACGTPVDEDYTRDQLEARAEPPEWG